MEEGNNFIINLVTTLQEAVSRKRLNDDIKRIQKNLDTLELKAAISSDSAENIRKQLENVKIKAEIDPASVRNIADRIRTIADSQGIVIRDIRINSGDALKAGQRMGEDVGKGFSTGAAHVRQSMDDIMSELSKKSLKSTKLLNKFNLNRPDVDAGVVKQVQNLTKELNALSKQAVKTNSDTSWNGIINKISELSSVLSQFGKTRDTSSYGESLGILDYFQGKKIYVGNREELKQNAGMDIRQLNTQLRNLGVTFTTVEKGSTKLDSIWTELFSTSPGLEKFTTFGDQASAVIDHLRRAKEALYGESTLMPLNVGDVTGELMDWLERQENAAKKMAVLKAQEAEIIQQEAQQSSGATETVIRNEQRKQEAYKQTAQEMKAISDFRVNTLPQVQDNVSSGFYAQQVEQQIEKYNRLGLELPDVKARIDELKAAEQELNAVMGNENATLEQKMAAYQRFQSSLRSANASNSIAASMYMTQNEIDGLVMRLQEFSRKHSGMTETAKAEISGWTEKLRGGGAVLKSVGNDASMVMKRIAAEQKNVEKSGNSFLASLKSGLSYWTSASYIVMRAIGRIRQAFSELKEVNTILTEISKVSQMTAKELSALGDSAFESASKYGKKASDYLTGIQDFSRAGFRGQDAENMAELSVLAQAAGDISAELSNKYLIATDSAYKLNGEAEKLNEILDGQNYIANNNAVAMEHLADATRVSASQAASAGVAVEEMSAAVGTMVSVTQDSGDVVGRAFKAILMNLQQVSGELDDGEIIDEESLTKYEKACNELGVSLKTVKDGIVSLRDPMQILKELSEAYTSLDKMDARRANLISAIGGKHRGNQLNALLENWQTYEKMLSDYSHGSGSAMNEAMKSASNWEGSLNRLHNTWVKTVQNIADSDAIITIINGTNSLLDVLNKLTSRLGSIGSIGLGAFALLNKGRSDTILPFMEVTPCCKF